jgi:flap endonuclease-1
MGIKNLFALIKAECPEVLLSFSLHEWSGCSIAIDISIFLNKFVKSSGNRWMDSFFLFLCSLKKHNIRAVCIFDGPNPPIEKAPTQKKRKDETAKALLRKDDCCELRDLIKRNHQEGFLPEDLQNRAKKIIGTKGASYGYVEWSHPNEVLSVLIELSFKLEKSTMPITNTHREKAWEIVKMIGLSTYQYVGEAESLAAYLANHERVDAVLTEDTDVLPYGTPWLLAYKDYKLSDEMVRAVYLPHLLDRLGLSIEEFRDLCIMLGCDYNKRDTETGKDLSFRAIPPEAKNQSKYADIGWKKALSLIDTYRTLEEVEVYSENIEVLDYPRCRELFSNITEEELNSIVGHKVEPRSTRPDFVRIEEFLKNENINVSMEYIRNSWKGSEIVFEDNLEVGIDEDQI